jgi:hypothetical protein
LLIQELRALTTPALKEQKRFQGQLRAMGDDDGLVGKITPRSFAPGFVVLSYVVSYIGALTTVELLQRRTSSRGWYNWYVNASMHLRRKR